MEALVILFIIMSIGYTVYWFFGKLFGKKKPEKKQINPYILYHSMKLKNDRDYEEYLKFCAKVGEAPIGKAGFEDARRAEKEINNLIK